MVEDTRETYNVEVVDVIRHQEGRVVDLFLRTPKDMNFKPSDGIGIPASLSKDKLFKFKARLKGREGEEHLTPHNGVAGPNYAYPSDALLNCLLSKAISVVAGKSDKCPFHRAIRQNAACLKMAMCDRQLKLRLKANYSVFDLVSLFPRILSSLDIIEHQPKEHGNKTYTVDGRSFIERNGVKCFRLSVIQDDGPTYRALFGEAEPEGIKPGQASSHLRSLEAGDVLTINAGTKSGPKVPAFENGDRTTLLVAQGNSMIRMLSLLENIRTRKVVSEIFGPIILVGAFKTKNEILELDELYPYLNDGTLSELHLCLSREENQTTYPHDLITTHVGMRVQDLFNCYPFTNLQNPFVLLSGGQKFYEGQNSVGHYLATRFGYDLDEIAFEKQTHEDMRVSNSPDRRHELQGKAYKAIDPKIALEVFNRQHDEFPRAISA